MRTLGNDVYIQRGETWSLDFDVTNSKGQPYMLLKEWQNPYLAITVTAARYAQEGDFRRTWWLDLDNMWVEKSDGSMELEPMKKFVSTEALNLSLFSVNEAIGIYGTAAGGKIVLDPESDFDITNYLFFVDENSDGNLTYKYVKSYKVGPICQLIPTVYGAEGITSYPAGTLVQYSTGIIYYVLKGADNTKIPGVDTDYFLECTGYDSLYQVSQNSGNTAGALFINASNNLQVVLGTNNYGVVSTQSYLYYGDSVKSEEWEEYNFRIIKQFVTADWVEQGYLFDMKVLAGESLEEHIHALLVQQGETLPDLPWTLAQLQEQINKIKDDTVREEMQLLYDDGAPLMPEYDTKSIILAPTRLFVSADIQRR